MAVKQTMWKKACTVFALFILSGIFWSARAVEISDQPILNIIKPPPANIMFLIDNSQTMNFEILMEGTRRRGLFYRDSDPFNVWGYAYLFGNDTFNVDEDIDSLHDVLESSRKRYLRKRAYESKRYWETRCNGYNRLYYNPFANYFPWIATKEYPDLKDADLLNPKLNPIGSASVSMKEEYIRIRSIGNDMKLDDDMADRSGTWSRSGLYDDRDGFTNLIFNGAYHASNDTSAKIIYPFELRETGEYEIKVFWPRFPRVDGSYVSKGNVRVRILDHAKNSLKNKEVGQGEDPVEGIAVEQNRRSKKFTVTIPEISSHGPDLYVELSHPGGNSWIVADHVEVKKKNQDSRISISNAHYVVFDDVNGNTRVDEGERLFLVNFAWGDFGGGEELYRQIYELPGGARVRDRRLETGSLKAMEPSALPDGLRRLYDLGYTDEGATDDGENANYITPESDLQNFTNWFQYYRTKLLATKAAISNSIHDLNNVNIGYHTIHKDVTQHLLRVNNKGDASTIIVDDRDGAGQYEESGRLWTDSNAAVDYNSNSRYTSTIGDATARWHADVPVPAQYDVYVRWSQYDFLSIIPGIRDNRAEYRVGVRSQKEGTISWGSKRVVNQNGSRKISRRDGDNIGPPNRWNLLTTITVDNVHDDKEVVVEVKRGSWLATRPTSADAIRLVRRDVDSSKEDNTETLLNLLYKIKVEMSLNKPLRSGLETIGLYYHADKNPSDRDLSTPNCPRAYESEEKGGGCQQAFVIMTTDGLWTATDSPVYGKNLGEIAKYFYETDLGPDLSDLVPVNMYDDNRKQHMVTYAMAFGNAGNIDPDSYRHWESDTPPNWPSGSEASWGDKEKMDDLFHATVQGKGLYLNAATPATMIFALREIIEDIIKRTQATGASLAVNGYRLREGTNIYQTEYYPKNWLGDLSARSLRMVNARVQIGDKKWSAAAQLNKMGTDRRSLITRSGSASFSFWPRTLPDDLKNDLVSDMHLSPAPTAADIVSYVRGEDKAGFRQRKAGHEGAQEEHYMTGDFVHSAPVYHRGLVYAGSNGGMLHAFDASTGDEVFGYIPSFVHSNLWELMRPDYMDNHRYFVDGPISIRTLVDDGGLKDVLVGGLRKGGKGYYGLTLRDSKGSWEVKRGSTENDLVDKLSPWEFPAKEDRPDNDMGYSFSSAAIVKSNLTDHPWIAIFGNGYNATSGEAVLIIVNALTGEKIRKIKTGASGGNGLSTPAVVDMDNNGTADWVYAGDLKGNLWKFDISSGRKDLWDVYFKSGTESKPLFTGRGGSWSGDGSNLTHAQPVTTKPGIARHCSGVGYMVVWGTGKYLHESDISDFDQQTLYGVWDHGLNRGSASNRASGWLGELKRSDVKNEDGVILFGLDGSTFHLVEQRVRVSSHSHRDGEIHGATGPGNNVFAESHTDHKQSYAFKKDSNDKLIVPLELKENSPVGWFFDLPDMGERMVQDAVIHGSHVFASSFVPEGSVSSCDSGGYSWLNALQSCSGRAVKVVFDVDGDGKLEGARKNKEGEWEHNDGLVAGDEAYVVSRTRVEGMMFTPAVVSGEDVDVIVYPTSDNELPEAKTVIKEGDGLFYWRLR
ncbi:PilC/PilY family type IV pilus protein [Desulfobotulus mexicanus]|uniref:PQQ-binding-like beta-propeller repeat protein n=1 Tax=Desulfobotulus mexicanus TaxID=2586642 RepID=A0A5Q4VDP2_9BACT|nr:PilC/PilY family type IV pilus protein [Desulfobotulus mexicanus]TYT75083.1 PQQ-binding-like beta-propeller repeat protein [Desulfobotulus mexicanus]